MFKHKQIWQLAFPMIIANISTPVLGLVDTAMMGHLSSPLYLGAVAIGGLIFDFLFWGFGFLRMGTTGLTAQAFGQDNQPEIKAILWRALLISMLIGVLILLCQKPIGQLGFVLIQSSPEIESLGLQYFNIRIWSAPATLSLYAISGWLLGLQNVKAPVAIVITTNLSNIALDLLFVVKFQWAVQGVALASVCAEYIGLILAIILLMRNKQYLMHHPVWPVVFQLKKIKAMLYVNQNLFVRTLCLIFAFAFFTTRSARFGELILAANTVLLHFQTFLAYTLDGLANAAEVLTGRAIGRKNKLLLNQAVLTTGLWSLIIAIVFSAIYFFFGKEIIFLLTNLKSVRNTALEYLPWLLVLPLISFPSFLLDGIFVGVTLSKQMRDIMIISVLGCYLPVYYFNLSLQNHGLWLAFTCFMMARSFLMMVVFLKKHQQLC
jgi:MATE family multidrug resistance protein